MVLVHLNWYGVYSFRCMGVVTEPTGVLNHAFGARFVFVHHL